MRPARGQARIDGRQALALLVIATAAKLFLTFPTITVQAAATAGWMLVFISGAIAGLSLWLLVLWSGKVDARQDVVGVVATGLRPALGTVTGLALAGLFMADLVLTARQFAEALITAILPETPISVITATLFAVALYGAYLGLETISRTAWILLPWIGGGMLLGGILTLPYSRPEQILPLWGRGLEVLLQRGITGTGHFSELLLILVIRPYLVKPDRAVSLVLGALFLSAVTMGAVTAQLIMVFPMPAGEGLPFPLLSTVRLVLLGRFLQRVEAAYVLVWVISGMLKMALVLYAAAVLSGRALRVPVHRPLLFSLALLAFSLSFVPRSLVEAVQWEALVFRETVVPGLVGLLVLVVALAAARSGRRGRGGRQ